MSVGDIHSTEKGSGARYNDGKPDYSLIPMHLLADTARVFEYGANKYSRNNWLKSMPWLVPYACLLRHAFAWFRGEHLDPESLLPHSAHMACNILMIIHNEQSYPQGDDRPTEHFNG